MTKLTTLLEFILSMAFSLAAQNQDADLIVTNDGETITAYNVDLPGGDFVYYTLSPGDDANLQRMKKSSILIIKKSDGTKIDPTSITEAKSAPQQKTSSIRTSSIKTSSSSGSTSMQTQSNTPATPNTSDIGYEPITHTAAGEIFTDKKGTRKIRVQGDRGQILEMKFIPGGNNELAVVEPSKGLEYDLYEYVIPEYVNINGEKYTVTAIDPKAFCWKWGNDELWSIKLPHTLKSIGEYAFAGCVKVDRIIIPDSVETIGEWAFGNVGTKTTFQELYIPKTLKFCGKEAFRNVGNRRSYRGYYQGYLSSCPDFINISNCTNYGIDEEAIEAYQRRR